MDWVRIVEVGARDGLQNEKPLLPIGDKISLIDQLSKTGLQSIEVTSFVSPKWVPQLADAAEVFVGIEKSPGIHYPVLVPNLQGYERAKSVGVSEVAIFTAASEAFAQKNTNASIAETLQRFLPIMAQAKADGIKVRGYVSCVLGCPYQGKVAIGDAVNVALSLYRMGCYEISMGDTIGAGTAAQARALMQALAQEIPLRAIAGHYHDTYGQALANVAASMEVGVRVFDSSVAGLGGCPYAKGASGNLASENLLYFLHGNGISTGIDLAQMADIGEWISETLGKPNQSLAGKAILAKR